MPKDPKKNVDRYKVRGGDINEFEYDQNQEALAQQKPKSDANLIPGKPPEEKAQDMRPVVAKKTAKKAAKKATKKTSKKKASVAARGASAKKLAAKKTAKKKAAKKK